MLIRKMTEQDICRVWEIEKQSFSMPWSEDGFMAALSMEDNILIVAEDEGRILGYACTYVSFDEGELTNIAVLPDARNSGVGKALLSTLKSEAVKKNLSRIVLEVRVSNDVARHVYKELGFYELGIRKNFYEQPVEDAMIMSCTLEED
ncbi:MAG: ribosomal protein S18-alanine N-acetyltransferase [Agathobacter sp.]|nr:ribosomal protein S18-alanine N-acetyltransferase [Agathobacter sp.]